MTTSTISPQQAREAAIRRIQSQIREVVSENAFIQQRGRDRDLVDLDMWPADPVRFNSSTTAIEIVAAPLSMRLVLKVWYDWDHMRDIETWMAQAQVAFASEYLDAAEIVEFVQILQALHEVAEAVGEIEPIEVQQHEVAA